MRVRDFQQVLGKFTNDQKGTIISDCPIYIETMDGRLEEIRRILTNSDSMASDNG